ncbi:MAG: flagellar basal-body MS-ring/collar protein FliF [Pseudomonadota bacterium]
MNSFIETMKGLGPTRLGMMAAIAAAILSFFIYLTSRLAEPDQALLYADLDSQDSGQIVSQLENQQQPYRLSADGSQIFVAADQVARLRVAMAEQGLPSGGSIGYEIFDRSEGLGTTNFVQNINHLRALEGELSRTIRSIARVRQARVHLVLPQRQLFTRDRQEPSASIILVMNAAGEVENQKVQAIQHLVAAAVPGLKPKNISVVDDKGNLLARGGDEGDLDRAATNAEEMRIKYEARLVRTIEDLLVRSLGPGNVRAQVTAEMDFDRITENTESYDPDGQVVRSTQVVEEQSNEKDGDPAGVTVGNNLPDAAAAGGGAAGANSQASRTEETVNYEISRTTKTHIREAGMVRRLSVAVMVNGVSTIGEDGQLSYTPIEQEQMQQIEALVRSAVGIDTDRGDRIEVVNMPFVDPASSGLEEESFLMGFEKHDVLRMAELLVLGALAIIVVLFVVRPMVSRLFDSPLGEDAEPEAHALLSDGSVAHPALAGPTSAREVAIGLAGPGGESAGGQVVGGGASSIAEIEHMIDVNQVEGRVRASSIRKIGEIIQKHPEEAVAIVRSWLHQET